jgi:hypothetical protein
MKIFYGRKEDGKLTYDTTDKGMQVFSTLTVADDQDMADVLDYLRTVVGQPVPSKPGFSWSYDETYRTQARRDEMRAAILAPAKTEKKADPMQAKEEEIVTCSCGHSSRKSLVMSTSTGSSCPGCYDRMSA